MKKLVFILFTLISTSAFAAGYGDAGCGLGSLVFQDQGGFSQVFAATTNGSFGSQTFGISSGTSNCSGAGKAPTQFIEVNKAALNNDIARGEGETLAALMEIYSCENSKDLRSTLKKNYQEIFRSQNPNEINTKIRNFIRKNSVKCKDLV